MLSLRLLGPSKRHRSRGCANALRSTFCACVTCVRSLVRAYSACKEHYVTLGKPSRENYAHASAPSRDPPRPREASNRGTEQSKTVRVPPTPKLGLAKAGPALAEAAHRVQKRWEPATPTAQAAI